MSSPLWPVLGLVLAAVLGLFLLRRRARKTRFVPLGRYGNSGPSTRTARGFMPSQQPVAQASIAAQTLLEEWRSASVEETNAPTQGTRLSRREVDKPFVTLEELEARLSYGAMRVKIEEARNLLKDRALDADVPAKIDTMLTERSGLSEHPQRVRPSTSAPGQGAREAGRVVGERSGEPGAGEPLSRSSRQRRRPSARTVRRRTTTGTAPQPWRGARRKSGS